MKHAPLTCTIGLAIALALSASAARAQPQTEWDGLALQPSTQFGAVYLAPGADFRGYTKIMIDPPEAAFRRDWQRNYNSTQRGLSGRISDNEAREALDLFKTGFGEIFRDAYARAGYQIVATPGPDVLRLRTAVLNIEVGAPDQMSSGRSRTYSEDVGQATLLLEARDSMSNALLGRAVDQHMISDSYVLQRSRVTNRTDFERLFRSWAQMSVEGLATLRAAMPGNAATPAG